MKLSAALLLGLCLIGLSVISEGRWCPKCMFGGFGRGGGYGWGWGDGGLGGGMLGWGGMGGIGGLGYSSYGGMGGLGFMGGLDYMGGLGMGGLDYMGGLGMGGLDYMGGLGMGGLSYMGGYTGFGGMGMGFGRRKCFCSKWCPWKYYRVGKCPPSKKCKKCRKWLCCKRPYKKKRGGGYY